MFNFGRINMRKITLASSALTLAMAAGNACAATASGPTAGSFGINVGFTQATAAGNNSTPANFLVNGKYFISKDMAVLAGVGFDMVDSGAAANSQSTNLGFQGGFRKYLKTDDLAPFVGGRLQYLSTRQGANDVTDFALMAEGGAEYFLARQFSLEGSVGFGYSSAESKPVAGGATTKATAFGSTMFNVSANFYF
jgi:hypothetical protein